ncbi:hypothetical protein [Lysinibacillus sp. OTC-L20]|uniref:hypothetical protein n=1 Tax=Lysinibacillus sp. OTC-L20 TaxID=3342791 RepID=UPI0035BA74D7
MITNHLKSNEESIQSTVYLDYNVFINYRNHQDVREILHNKKTQYNYCYGPPYLEEVANIPSEKIEDIQSHKNDIDTLFEFHTFRPTDTNKLVKVQESAATVLKRVTESLDLSKKAEEHEKSQFSLFKSQCKELNFDPKKMSNIPFDEIFNHADVFLFVEELAINNPVFLQSLRKTLNSATKKNFTELQHSIAVLFNVLEIVGFRPEAAKKARSRMHDVSHAVYASQCDFFIVEDNKFREKCKAVYHFLKINTKVLSYNEFIENF